jgi:hypothetical protein
MRRGLWVFVSGVALAMLTLAGATVAAGQEPAKPVLTLDGDAAVITTLIKPDKTADFESVIAKLREALGKNEKPERKQQLAGWKIFKSSQMAPGGAGSGLSAVYIFYIDPVLKDQEYDLTRLINEVFPSEALEYFNKYKEAFAGRAITALTKVP